jgi:hypothetical protein
MAVAYFSLLAFGIVATIIGSRSFLQMRSATDASEVFAFVMQALAIAGFGIILSGYCLQQLAGWAL